MCHHSIFITLLLFIRSHVTLLCSLHYFHTICSFTPLFSLIIISVNFNWSQNMPWAFHIIHSSLSIHTYTYLPVLIPIHHYAHIHLGLYTDICHTFSFIHKSSFSFLHNIPFSPRFIHYFYFLVLHIIYVTHFLFRVHLISLLHYTLLSPFICSHWVLLAVVIGYTYKCY